MSTFVEQISIAAPQHLVWKVLADIGSIHKWNPGVVDSHMTTVGEVGNGAGRRCELGGKIYLDERIVEWEPEKALTMRIVKTNLPFQVADIRFTLEEQGEQTLVTVAPQYRLKFGIVGALLDMVFVRAQYRKGMVNLLRGLKQYIEDKGAG